MKPSLPVLLGVNGGYVDTAGYLALQGLFTSHVTGNFVTLGAALVLIAGALLAIHLGPFASGDGWPAIVTGMTLIAAMAIQNAIHRIHMATTSPTTIMTGNTTQVMIDLADLLRPLSPEASATVRARLRRLSASVAAFAIGCSTAALLFALRGVWCFLVPPVLGLCTLLISTASEKSP